MIRTQTRGGVNPSGKQKVYYASYGEDFGYLGDVSRHLLEHADLAIYYEEDGDTGNTPDEDILSMNMVAMVLSESSFHAGNDALIRILPLALRHHIPLLPLAVSPQIGAMFSDFCDNNDLPRLDVFFPNSEDETEIAFSDKLHTWMDHKLTDPGLHDRILANFHTSFFISYRKKDRAVLRSFLDTVLQYDGCREIRFWFDEYLTAGESFDREIEAMIDSADLFILLMTQNMLKEDNYAIREELHRAIERKKSILVFDLSEGRYPVPEQLLCYPDHTVIGGISERQFDRITGWDDLMGEYADHPSYPGNREYLEHIYLLGMAYYRGIGAPADRRTGLAAITRAANDGLVEAMKMMVQIAVEENGDYETAVMYQRRIVDLSDARAMRTGRLEDVVTFFGDLSALGDYCYSMQDVSSCEEVYRQMIAALEGIRDLTGHKALLEYAVIACIRLGDLADIRLQRSRSAPERNAFFREADHWYKRSYEYALCYAEEDPSLKAMRNVYAPLMRLADDRYMYLDLPWSTHLASYLEIYKRIREADERYPCADTRADLSACSRRLMEIHHAMGNTGEAVTYGQRMLDDARRGYLELRDFDHLAKYMEALEAFSVLQYKTGDLTEACRNLNKATKARWQYMECLRKQGIDGTGSARVLITDYVNLSDLLLKRGREEEAKTVLEQAMILASQYHFENDPEIREVIASRMDIL